MMGLLHLSSEFELLNFLVAEAEEEKKEEEENVFAGGILEDILAGGYILENILDKYPQTFSIM